MSLLCLSATDVAEVTSQFTPSFLQTLMARVFLVLSRGSPAESTTPPRIVFPTQNHTALFMPARIAQENRTMDDKNNGNETEPKENNHNTNILRGTSIKVVCVPTSPSDTRGLPASTLVLNEETGAVKAIVNASKLTALRNAAGSLLSVNLVGPPPKDIVHVVAFGAGVQIECHLDLHLRAFTSIRTCTIINRSLNERALKLADLLRSRFPEVEIVCLAHDATTNPSSTSEPQQSKVQTALLSAQLIICATSSTTPLLPSAWVRDGTHVILVGSYKPTMHEVEGALVRRALLTSTNRTSPSRLVVDSRAACLAEAGELIAADVKPEEVVEIGELVAFGADGELRLPHQGHLADTGLQKHSEAENRGTSGPVTIFKSVGVGLQDVAIACAVVDKAQELGMGTSVGWS
ncbi:hypothetical protein R3P38DRAFT_2935458 [Favolaschia claudopus]|uniref:NAD(P)-binding protein n=1 Tax=Favolaschia claudopus TaxID=2862362 RepID=A0AAW0BM82_9AGAR